MSDAGSECFVRNIRLHGYVASQHKDVAVYKCDVRIQLDRVLRSQPCLRICELWIGMVAQVWNYLLPRVAVSGKFVVLLR